MKTLMRAPEATRMTEIRRIAVLRALNLGDLLLAVPALRSLRAGFPDAEITLIGLPWAEKFARRFGHYVDRFIELPELQGLTQATITPARLGCFFEEQRAHRYDLVLQMHGAGVDSNRCALALGGRLTIGYYTGEAPTGLVLAAEYPESLPEVRRNLDLALMIGCPDMGCHLEFPLYTEERIEARRLLGELQHGGGPWVAVHPGAGFPVRCWPPAHFARVADELGRRLGACILLTGGPREVALADAVVEDMEHPAVNLAGKTSLGGLAALLQQMDLLLCNDAGPGHLAEAVGTPTVRIYGPSPPERWASLDPGRHRTALHPERLPGRKGWDWPEPAAAAELAADLLAAVTSPLRSEHRVREEAGRVPA